MDEATRLGEQMASEERVIRPSLGDGCHQMGYVQFLELHRHRLEQHAAFARWDARIAEIARREAAVQQINLDRADKFERYIRQIARPIRCSFWYGWESAVGLRQKFEEAARTAGDVASSERMAALADVRRQTELGAYAERVRTHSGGSGIYDLTVTELEARPGDVRVE